MASFAPAVKDATGGAPAEALSCCTAHLYVCGQQRACEPEAGGKKLKCPECFALGFDAIFCSKKCFSRVWSQHKRLHALWARINAQPTPGHRKGSMRLEEYGHNGGHGSYFGEVRDAKEGMPTTLWERFGRGNGDFPMSISISGYGEVHSRAEEANCYDCLEGYWRMDGAPVVNKVKLTQGIGSKAQRNGSTQMGNTYCGGYAATGGNVPGNLTQIRNLLPQGRGIRIYGSNGDIFIGEWQMGSRTDGTMTSADGKTVYTGKCVGGLMRKGEGRTRKEWHQIGTQVTEFGGIEIPTFQVDKEVVYCGEYNKSGGMDGYGKFTWENGDTFEGMFKKNKIFASPTCEGIFFHHSTGTREVIRDPARAADLQSCNDGKSYLSFDVGRRGPGGREAPRLTIAVPLFGSNRGSIVIDKSPEAAFRAAEEACRRPSKVEEEEGWVDREDEETEEGEGEIID